MNRTKLTRKEKVKIQEEKKRIEQSKLKFKGGVWLITIGTIFFLLFGNIWLTRNSEINDNQLITIKAIVKKPVEKKWIRKVGNQIFIELADYPNKKFKVGRIAANSIDLKSLNKEISINGEVELQILDKDWVKIEKKKTIFVYGIRKHQKEYLSVNTYNRLRKKGKNSIATYVLNIWSLMIIGYGAKLVIENRRTS